MAKFSRNFRPYLVGIVLGSMLMFMFNVVAEQISAPPRAEEISPALQHWLNDVYKNIHVLEVTTTAPNGARKGVPGRMVIYNNSGTLEFWVAKDTNTTWQQI